MAASSSDEEFTTAAFRFLGVAFLVAGRGDAEPKGSALVRAVAVTVVVAFLPPLDGGLRRRLPVTMLAA